MTELRKRFIKDLQLKGYSVRTQDMYVRAVRQLSQHYKKTPDLITDEELPAVRPVKKEQSAKPVKFKCPNCGKPMIAVQDIPAKRGPPFSMPFSQHNEANLK